MSITVDNLISEGKSVTAVPAYLTKYKLFYSWIQAINGYIKLTYTDNAVKILKFLAPAKADNNISQELLSDKMGITFPNAITDSNIRKIFLMGSAIGFSTQAYIEGLEELIKNSCSPAITDIRITDNSILKGDDKEVMKITAFIVGTFPINTDAEKQAVITALKNYFIPDVTGVALDIIYINKDSDIFAYDFEEDEIGDKLYRMRGWDEGHWYIQ